MGGVYECSDFVSEGDGGSACFCGNLDGLGAGRYDAPHDDLADEGSRDEGIEGDVVIRRDSAFIRDSVARADSIARAERTRQDSVSRADSLNRIYDMIPVGTHVYIY
jgi:hypothetical protein